MVLVLLVSWSSLLVTACVSEMRCCDALVPPGVVSLITSALLVFVIVVTGDVFVVLLSVFDELLVVSSGVLMPLIVGSNDEESLVKTFTPTVTKIKSTAAIAAHLDHNLVIGLAVFLGGFNSF